MEVKTFFGFMFFLLVVGLLVMYLLFPTGEFEFIPGEFNSNFSFSPGDFSGMQFYENMRYVDKKISYKISGCTLQKEDDMLGAFEIVKNNTILEFYPVSYNEEISVTCDSKAKMEEGMFIAGEGGPTNITKTDNFNVILNGKVLLLKQSDCERPNIALHELFHALGFKHSTNKDNIMYNFSRCRQTIGDDSIDLINEIYSTESLPDLSFENLSAKISKKYILNLDTNVSIRNNGLKKSDEATLFIYGDGHLIKEIFLKPIDIGYGRTISLSNIPVTQLSVSELKFKIVGDFEELDKENNEQILLLKK